MRSWLSETSPEEATAWESAMLDHPFGEDEWAEARTRLKNLLHQDARVAGEGSMLAYLCCCAESTAGSHPLPSLASVAEEFYQEHGMEGSQEAGS